MIQIEQIKIIIIYVLRKGITEMYYILGVIEINKI